MMGYISKRYIALIALGILLLLAVTFLFQALTIYDTQVIVKAAGDPIGMAPFTDRIDFGDVPQGEGVGKTLIMENEGAIPNQVVVFVIGNIGDLVTVNPDSVSLEPGERVEVDFNLTMPVSAPPEKKYTGKVLVLRLPKRLF
jgi:hypothetical protein